MLLSDFLSKGVKNGMYAKTKEGKAFARDASILKSNKDSDIIININVGEGDQPGPEIIAAENVEIPAETPTNTEGTEYKGYTIKQENDGRFLIYSIGGALITEAASLELAMNIINGMAIDGE
jgi:hypothetical protein